MLKQNVLCTVHSKVSPFLQVLLLFNFSTSKSQLIIILVVCTKYFGLTILSNNYIIDITKANTSQAIVAAILRKGTMFYFFRSSTPPVYFSICVAIYVLVFALLAYCWKYAIHIKKRKLNITLELFPKLMFYFLLLFGQHVLELLSMILIIILKPFIHLPESDVYLDYHDYGMLMDNETNYTISICVIGILNFIFYILINISLFFCYYLINNPFHYIKAPLSFRHKQYSIFLVTLMNLYSLHYWEVLIDGTVLIVYKNIVLVIVLGVIIGQIGFNLYKYEQKNFAYKFMEYMSVFNLISILIEIMITFKEYYFAISETIMIFILKLIISAILINYEHYIQGRYFSNQAKTYLFEAFDHSHLNQIIESYYYLLGQLIILKNQENAHVLVDIISTHKSNCQNEFCKCKLVKPFPEVTSNNQHFKHFLLYNIGFLMETTFIHIINYSNIEIAIFLAHYYYHIKENILMSFSIIQSTFTLRRARIHSVNVLNLYYINQIFINEYIERFRLFQDAVKFTKVFEDISTNFDFYKGIVKYGNAFDSLIDAKMLFESSIKFENDQDTGEVRSISSSLNNKETVWHILNGLEKINRLSKGIKVMLKSPHGQKRGLEFYYIIYLFYLFFDRKIPSKLIRKFSELTVGESFIGLTQKETRTKFDRLLDRYLSRASSINQVIIKCSKGLLIKYFSSNLCNLLGFSKSSLLGEPFHSIFPRNLRESHSMAIFHTMINNRLFFFKKSTVIFDANEHYLPCEVSAGVMPHLSKQLLIICEVEIHNQNRCDYSFILDDKFNGISISENAEKKYNITLSLLKKADNKLIDVFDINPKCFTENFAPDLRIISQFKSEMKLCTIEAYSKLLYHFQENSNENICERDDKKFKISNLSLNINHKMKNIRPKICQRSIKFTKIKSVITLNIIKALNKLSDSPIKEEKLKQLSSTVVGLKKTLTEINKSASKFTYDLVPCEPKPISIVITYKVELKSLYDMPLYLVRLTDSVENYKIQKIDDNERFSPRKAMPMPKKDYSQIDNMLKKGVSLKRIRAKTIESMFSKTKQEIVVIIIAVMISFFISLYILIDEISNIENIITSMGFVYISRFHLETLLNYEATLFSFAFDFGGYTAMNIKDGEFYDSFDYLTFSLENSLIFFYHKLDAYNKNLNQNFYSFLQNCSYTKIVLNWSPVAYQSDFITEIHYVIYLSRMVLKEKNKELMQKDIKQLFFKRYLNEPLAPINSPYGAVLYFVGVNVPLSLSTSIQSVIKEATMKILVYLTNNKNLIVSFEVICYISNLFFYFFVVLFLRKYNKQVIKLIIAMFLDNSTKKAKNSFKNKGENIYMKQKIKLLIQLIHNFNEDNSNAMKTFLENHNLAPNISSHNNNKRILMLNDTNTNANNNSLISYNNPSVNITNSINISQAHHTTSQNLLFKQSDTNNNHIIKKLVPFSAIAEKNNQNSKSNNENEDITNHLFIELLQKKCVCIIHRYLFAIYCCLVVNLIFSVLRFCNTLDYQNYSIVSLDMFTHFTNFLMAIPVFFNSFRNKIMNHNGTLEAYHNISLIIEYYQQGVIDTTTSKSFLKFPNSRLLWEQLNMKMNDPRLNKEYLCFNDSICLSMLDDPNSMFADGIFLGYQLIIQKTLQSFSDYKLLTSSKPDFTANDLKERVLTHDFVLIQKYTQFILHRIQSNYYISFDNDYKIYSQAVETKTIYLNTIIFLIDILGILLIIFCIIAKISKKLYQISFSCEKFNVVMFNSIDVKE